MYYIEAIDKKNTRCGNGCFDTYKEARAEFDRLVHDDFWGVVRMWDYPDKQLFMYISYEGLEVPLK